MPASLNDIKDSRIIRSMMRPLGRITTNILDDSALGRPELRQQIVTYFYTRSEATPR